MDSLAERLRPCPFCGGAATFMSLADRRRFADVGDASIECVKCEANVSAASDYGVVAIWNNRKAEAADALSRLSQTAEGLAEVPLADVSAFAEPHRGYIVSKNGVPIAVLAADAFAAREAFIRREERERAVEVAKGISRKLYDAALIETDAAKADDLHGRADQGMVIASAIRSEK